MRASGTAERGRLPAQRSRSHSRSRSRSPSPAAAPRSPHQCQLLTLVPSARSSTIQRGSPCPHLAMAAPAEGARKPRRPAPPAVLPRPSAGGPRQPPAPQRPARSPAGGPPFPAPRGGSRCPQVQSGRGGAGGVGVCAVVYGTFSAPLLGQRLHSHPRTVRPRRSPPARLPADSVLQALALCNHSARLIPFCHSVIVVFNSSLHQA